MASNDENDIMPLELPELNLPLVNKNREKNDDFMSDLVQVANEVNKAIIIVSGIVPQKKIELEKLDVIKGHLVRLYKLYDSYIFLIVSRRTEIAFIVLRALTETVINLEYLLKHNSTGVYKKYKRASLSYENNLQENILENILSRGSSLSIEKRMLKSIKDTFIRSGIENIEEEEIKKTKWGVKKGDLDISGKAKDVALESSYRIIYKSSSHFVHGSWHELDFYHLDKDLDSFGGRKPQMKYGTPKPQLIEAISIIVLNALSKYLFTITETGDHSTKVNDYLEDISSWFVEMTNKHEEFLQSK